MRMMKRTGIAVLLVALLGSLVVAADGPMYGTTLRVALASEPGKLDMPLDSGVDTSIIARHMVEGLFAFDENYAPQPMLALSWDLDEDGANMV